MDSLPLNPDTATQLEELSARGGRDPVEVGNRAPKQWLAKERQDSEAAVAAANKGYAAVRAGRTRPAEDVLEDLRRKHDIPDRAR